MRFVWTISLLLAAFLAAAGQGKAQQASFSGDVTRVIDAATLQIGGDRVRLWGLYTTSLDTPRGADASLFVHKLTLGRQIRCEEIDWSDETILARCWVGGTDLTEAIIAAGHGRECQRDSKGTYRRVEAPFVLIRMPLPPSCII